MNQILDFAGYALDYINWVIQFHLAQYFYIALGFIFIALVLLIFIRSKAIYIFPIIFAMVSIIFVLMVLTGTAQFSWDYMLLVAFVNFAAGYVLFVFISMVLSKPQI